MGYVGLPLAIAFSKKFKVVGYDIDDLRIQDLRAGNDKTLEIEEELLRSVESNISYTSNINDIS